MDWLVPQMKDWSIPGPDAPYLTVGEVVAFCRMASERQLERMVLEERFPPGLAHGGRGPSVWKASDIACWMWLASSMPALFALREGDDEVAGRRIKRKPEEKKEEKS